MVVGAYTVDASLRSPTHLMAFEKIYSPSKSRISGVGEKIYSATKSPTPQKDCG
jgi:hypothetical protein